MNSLEKEIINKQATLIGQLTTNVLELDLKLTQALATVQAMEKELEGYKNGDIEQPNATGRETSPTEGLQQG